MKKIIAKSHDLSNKEIYQLTISPRTEKMANHVGERLEIAAWARFEDADKKNPDVVNEILALLTPENEVFATVSATFKNDFADMVEMMGKVDAIDIVGGKSKAGRDFITCALAL